MQKPTSKSIQSRILKERKINDLNRRVDEEKLQLLWYYLKGNTMSEKKNYLINSKYIIEKL